MSVEVSVVMPLGRIDRDFGAALAAVLAQEAPVSFEVVLSMNCPDPAAWSALARLTSAVGSPRLRVVDSASQRGAAHARNVGARAACGRLVAFCDSDDVAEAGWLASLVDGLGHFDAVSGPVSDERFVQPGQAKWRLPTTSGALPTFLGVPYLLSGNLGIKRGVFADVGGFDTKLTRCEDIALSWSLLRSGHALGYAPGALIHYRPRPSLRSMVTQHFHYGRGMSEVLVRYGVPRDGTRNGTMLFRANGQRSSGRSLEAGLRRASTAAGRAVGLATEGAARVRADRSGRGG